MRPTARRFVLPLAAALLGAAALQTGRAGDSMRTAEPPRDQWLTAAELFPLEPRSRAFSIVDGDGEGQTVTMTLRQSDEEQPRHWKLEFGNLNTLHLIENRDGSITVDRLDITTERETVLYEPPALLLPAAIVPGRSWQASGIARVWDWDAERFEHRGRYQHEIPAVTTERFITPSGTYEGVLLELDQTVDFEAAAQIRLNLDSGFLAGEGLVKRSMKLVVDKPLWLGRTTRRTAELAD